MGKGQIGGKTLWVLKGPVLVGGERKRTTEDTSVVSRGLENKCFVRQGGADKKGSPERGDYMEISPRSVTRHIQS